jgi:hypothetical protein
MVLDPAGRRLLILGGEQDGKVISDLWSYDLTSNVASELSSNVSVGGGPTCAGARAVFDPKIGELYVLAGLAPETGRPPSSDELQCWVYRLQPSSVTDEVQTRWMKALDSPEEDGEEKPQLRNAHQVLYHAGRETLFVHGGNPGRSTQEGEEETAESRLGDFWSMKLERCVLVGCA